MEGNGPDMIDRNLVNFLKNILLAFIKQGEKINTFSEEADILVSFSENQLNISLFDTAFRISEQLNS